MGLEVSPKISACCFESCLISFEIYHDIPHPDLSGSLAVSVLYLGTGRHGYTSFLGTQATGKAMWKIRTRKELTPIFIILNLTRHDKHGCISGPNMSQLYTYCMQTYLNISVIRMHLLLNSGFMI